ncbi:UDP-2,3-diacylglucosamine hydrolase [Steroidobacter agaridevorans]|uniref:UDP-2,3-diacylglucosamine hydrolase n=1 Tax=Steroidobacter agaridevorans TaxID=2695856 RepID=A0A829Y8V1_9GAMM|nr:UDP-2,3-diacylglucosamine diphosphatase [Steroidobacter agaridevorans]GFE79737.1 UDP-2,3-diacylglucosamine hydrolase [Steroidobacter agaridevorans]
MSAGRPTLFISDLHLDGERPDITAQFLQFLDHEARQAAGLYILGDLFEAWIGDDDPDPDKRRVIAALKSLTGGGVPVYFIHGNRDFLIGRRFARETGVKLLPDGTMIELYGKRVLLMHGDTLCIDDPDYQRLRRIVRNPLVQFVLRCLSLGQRQKLAAKMRAGSKKHIESMDRTQPQIMDVNQGAVYRTFEQEHADVIVHGHTHRPAIHDVDVGGHVAKRIVLGDWYEQGSVLRWNEQGFELAGLGR